jgi:RNA polymerase sigma-70 factor (ECF subfamily)
VEISLPKRNDLDQREATKRFYDVVWPQRSALLRVAQILTHDVHDAEDLTQDTLVKAFRAIEQFKEGTDARKWLLSILRNTRIDRLRARALSAKEVSLDQFPMDVADGRSAQATEGDGTWENPIEILSKFSDNAVIAALQKLPEEVRWTLLLVDVEDLKNDEAATLLSVPVGTVKSRMHRGRALLRDALINVAHERRLIPGD